MSGCFFSERQTWFPASQNQSSDIYRVSREGTQQTERPPRGAGPQTGRRSVFTAAARRLSGSALYASSLCRTRVSPDQIWTALLCCSSASWCFLRRFHVSDLSTSGGQGDPGDPGVKPAPPIRSTQPSAAGRLVVADENVPAFINVPLHPALIGSQELSVVLWELSQCIVGITVYCCLRCISLLFFLSRSASFVCNHIYLQIRAEPRVELKLIISIRSPPVKL